VKRRGVSAPTRRVHSPIICGECGHRSAPAGRLKCERCTAAFVAAIGRRRDAELRLVALDYGEAS
jgi:tRNA(Ile2) C34 agmatinyltransferase TiaS